MAEVIGNFLHFNLRIGSGELKCRVSNRALLKMSFAESDMLPPEALLAIFASNRNHIERIALEKFGRGDRWLGGVWVTTYDVTEDLLRIEGGRSHQ